ncbi:MAG: hypothetical protein HY680_01620 [Chloroflexi bacterium]|nr:hypothetical protein [Chloroflexota bacterium]
MIGISLDTEWVLDEVLACALDTILAYDVKLTVFATHDTPVLRGLDPGRVEIGLHPNFRPVALDDTAACRARLEELLALYPQAQGVRCHSLVSSTPLSDLFAQEGLKYESNTYLPGQPNLSPFRIWNGLVRVPIYMEDDRHCAAGGDFQFRPEIVAAPGVKVFLVHPVQIFLNVEHESRYLAAKKSYRKVEELKKLRYGGAGVRTFVEGLCSHIQRQALPTYTLSEIADTARTPPLPSLSPVLVDHPWRQQPT